MKVRPLNDRVVLKPLEAEEKTASGIVIPDNAKEKPAQGEVIAVGPGKIKGGKRIPADVKVGDTVLYAKFGPQEVKLENESVLILREEDILAVIEK